MSTIVSEYQPPLLHTNVVTSHLSFYGLQTPKPVRRDAYQWSGLPTTFQSSQQVIPSDVLANFTRLLAH